VRPRIDWRSKRQVLFLILGVVAIGMIAGGAAAWFSRNNTICADGKPPVRQQAGLLGQGVYQCHDGKIVTTPG
jgi:hypothetical protein